MPFAALKASFNASREAIFFIVLPQLLVFVDNFDRFGRSDFAVDFSVDDHHRSQSAGTDATECGNGEKTIRSRVGVSFDAEDALDFRKNFFRTFDVAGSTHADIDAVFAFGFSGEVVVETDNTGNVSFGEEKFLGDMDLNFAGQVTENILRAMQNLDQPAATAFIITVDAESIDESIKLGKFGG